MQVHVAPIVTDFWMRGQFPFQIIEELKKLNVCGLTIPKKFDGHPKTQTTKQFVCKRFEKSLSSVH